MTRWARPIVLALAITACSAGPEPAATTTAAPRTTAAPATTSTVPLSGVTVETLIDELDTSTGGVSVAADGTVYMASMGPAPRRQGHRIYRLAPGEEPVLWVEDDRLRGASGNAIDAEGNLYQASLRTGDVFRITPDGVLEAFATGLGGPVGVVLNPDGGLFVADCGDNAVVAVSSTGEPTTLVSDPRLSCPNGITRDGDGNLYVVSFNSGAVFVVAEDGAVRELASIPGGQGGHIVFLNGVLYAVARKSHQIVTVSLDGEVAPFAGTGERGFDDGAAELATFSLPNGIAIGPDGSLYVNEVASPTIANNFPVSLRVIRFP